jgi:preprotein translocase subunit SecD
MNRYKYFLILIIFVSCQVSNKSISSDVTGGFYETSSSGKIFYFFDKNHHKESLKLDTETLIALKHVKKVKVVKNDFNSKNDALQIKFDKKGVVLFKEMTERNIRGKEVCFVINNKIVHSSFMMSAVDTNDSFLMFYSEECLNYTLKYLKHSDK